MSGLKRRGGAAKQTVVLSAAKTYQWNAPTKMMKEAGVMGAGYAYDHAPRTGSRGRKLFSDGMEGRSFYQPVERGLNGILKTGRYFFEKLRRNRGGKT